VLLEVEHLHRRGPEHAPDLGAVGLRLAGRAQREAVRQVRVGDENPALGDIIGLARGYEGDTADAVAGPRDRS
jgi:hypothetical protein